VGGGEKSRRACCGGEEVEWGRKRHKKERASRRKPGNVFFGSWGKIGDPMRERKGKGSEEKTASGGH